MQKLRLFLLSAALVIPVAALAQFARAPARPPQPCNLQVSVRPDRLAGFYTVRAALPSGCPPAAVRLESYVGGTYPRDGWFRVSTGHPLIRSGIPWYWRVARKVGAKTFHLSLPGTEAP